MRKLATALAVMTVALASFGVGAAAAYIEPYTGPGVWFSAGQGRAGQYDWCGGYWTGNNFAKASSALGLATFIKPSGSWSNGIQKYGNIFNTLSSYSWHKKPYCKNSSGTGYQGGCWGDRQDNSGSCA
ncbi:MAG TPA: hypothetical protein VMK83_04785 [Gaiellaceae bacterium]|nr:hypothetical protein [Gaiellaceae bacterium]